MKKAWLKLTVILVCTYLKSNGQSFFQKIYGTVGDNIFGSSFVQTADSGFIITGVHQIFGGPGIDDVVLLKTNANGNLLWAKSYGGPGYENGRCVQQTADGGYIIAGNASGGFGAGGTDIYLIKTNDTGTLLWSKTFGGTLDDFANSVLQTADGGYLVAGMTRSYGAGNEDMYLIKTDVSGNLVWSKVIGSIGRDWVNAVQSTTDGAYILTGRIFSGGISNNDDLALIKMDATGNILWIKSHSAGNDDTEGYSCRQTNDGGFIITGFFGDIITFNTDIYLLKTDSSGSVQWSKTMSAVNNDLALSVKQTNDGGYLICGHSGPTTNASAIKTNATGTLLWSKSYGGNNNDSFGEVHQANDGGYIFCGMTQNFALGDGSIYLVKTDTNGVSGCNESGITFTVTNPSTQTVIPSYSSTSGGIANTPATNTGSGVTLTTLCNSSVGINQITTDDSFLIFPNPSAGNFIISFEGKILNGKIEVLNALGENIYTKNIFNETKKEVKLENISRGIYLVKVFDRENYYCKKLIVE